MSTRFYTIFSMLALFLLTSCSGSQTVTEQKERADRAQKKKKEIKKYSDVITAEAVTDEGLFIIHQLDDKLYFEIPKGMYDKPMLLISRIAQTPQDIHPFISGGTKAAEQVVRWHQKEDKILLRRKSYEAVADSNLPIAKSVVVNNFEPVIMAFDIETVSPDSQRVVIDATDLFMSDVEAISGLRSFQRREFKVRRLDKSRTFIDEAKSFPENINILHTMTFDAGETPSNDGTGSISMQMNQSMVLLPEEPMMPRLADSRVGYFSINQVNYGSDAQKADEQTFIRRWRLVPEDKEAYMRGELVEPSDPIIYYLDPATPEKWRPFFCQGVEDWQAAFESAGFKNAIECRMPPENDEDFHPEDVRFSTVRYVASTTRNATGPSTSDPRTGEIIESDIRWFHNHIRSYRNRLLIETGAANPDARSLELPIELIGETMRQVIAHEIGHALGLPHNMIASSAYPVDSLRNPDFAQRMGVAPTIMDYARQNYIAQPGDGLQNRDFIRQIGPYDHYAIEWGYRWYPEIEKPADETDKLNAMILEHAGDKMYRFGGRVSYNPESQTEDLGDDPVKASGYAVQNLKKVVPNMVTWTSRGGENYEDLEEIYGELTFQWYRYMNHVTTLIGGIYENRKTYGQEGAVYNPVPRHRQEEAVEFLSNQVFKTPEWLLNKAVLRRIEPAGAVDRIRSFQDRILSGIIAPPLLQRMVEAEALSPETAYPLDAYLSDLRKKVWRELEDNRPVIDIYRRNLQRVYLDALSSLMTESFDIDAPQFFGTSVSVSQSDIRPAVRFELQALLDTINSNLNATSDTRTIQHLEDAKVRINKLLNDKD